MNKIKDFIYDKNDLLVAFFIVISAALIIMMRVDIIMAYPLTLDIDSEKVPANPPRVSGNITPPTGEEQEGTDTGGEQEGTDAEEEQEGTDKDVTSNEESNKDNNASSDPASDFVTIKIEYGATAGQIAQLLIDSGLIATKEVFYNAIADAGAETKLQAGSFKIPVDAPLSKIIHIITN